MPIFNLSSCELIYLASSLSIAISNELTLDEINILACFLTTLGDNLALIAAKQV